MKKYAASTMPPEAAQGAGVPSALGLRIKAVADLFGSRLKAAEAANLSTDQLARYFSGESKAAFAPIAQMASHKGVRLDWIWTGEGPMLHREAAEAARPWVTGEGSAPGLTAREAGAGHDRHVPIPFHPGSGDSAPPVAFDRSWLRSELGAEPSDLCLVRVEGDGMDDVLHAGDAVLVDRRETGGAREGLHAVRIDGVLLVKYLQRLPGGIIEVSSENKAYRPFAVQLSDDGFVIIGRVLLSLRRS